MAMFLLISIIWQILPLACALVEYPTSLNTSSTWINNSSMTRTTFGIDDPEALRPIFVLLPTSRDISFAPQYAFGFYCSNISGISPCQKNISLLAIVIVLTTNASKTIATYDSLGGPIYPSGSLRVVWSANLFQPVEENANLTFTSGGDLLLWDANGTHVWSTNTKGVRPLLSLLSTGSLVVADAMNNNSFLWQSLDDPINTLVLGQTLKSGMNLTSNTNSGYYVYMNQTSLIFHNDGKLVASILSNPTDKTIDTPFVKYVNGSLDLFVSSSSHPDKSLPVRPTPTISLSFLQIGNFLSVSTWDPSMTDWTEENLFPSILNSSHLLPPLPSPPSLHPAPPPSSLPSPPSLHPASPPSLSPALSPSPQSPSSGLRRIMFGVVLSVVLSSAAVAVPLVLVCRRRRKKTRAVAEDIFGPMPGLMLTRFSLKELKVATNNFATKLGSGGFGSVFLGVLPDGSEVAVKRLENAKQGQKEFRNEVCIIGSIRHLNLVRLRGFCAEKNCHCLLVYEYMPNGSLEKWLFHNNKSNQGNDAGNINPVLPWELRLSIALGIARGLAYLHEECSERIIHLDIKPHNILLDNHFVPKVSDFGLSKLMNREQSHVVTKMQGTRGYLAPEWLHSTAITEKADVYSFGILLFEIASGRRYLDMSAELESEVRHTPMWASRMVEEGRLMDVIDARLLQDLKVSEAERMVKVALWCIQESPSKRPSMGTVVQMLEGIVECPHPPSNVSTTYQYTARTSIDNQGYNSGSAMESRLLACTLSGPR